jgi:hypothetical protein
MTNFVNLALLIAIGIRVTAGDSMEDGSSMFPLSLPAALGNGDIGYVEYQWKV